LDEWILIYPVRPYQFQGGPIFLAGYRTSPH